MNKEKVREEYVSVLLKLGEKKFLQSKLDKQVKLLETINSEVDELVSKAHELEALFLKLPEEVTSEDIKE